jgi:hypothetical protein
MLLLNPKKYQDRNYPDERSREIMLKTIAFFVCAGYLRQGHFNGSAEGAVPDNDQESGCE